MGRLAGEVTWASQTPASAVKEGLLLGAAVADAWQKPGASHPIGDLATALQAPQELRSA